MRGAASIAQRPAHAMAYRARAACGPASRIAIAAIPATSAPCHVKWINVHPVVFNIGVISILPSVDRASSE
jgi:hypothetical protein